MSRKALVLLGLTVGSLAGGFIPSLWGAGSFSFDSFLLSTLGGIAGVVVAYKVTAGMD